MHYSLVLPILGSFSIFGLVTPVVAQLPPREPEIPPIIPSPQKPEQIPFEVEPQNPPRNDLLPSITVGQFKIIGNTAISSREIEKVTAPYLNQLIGQTELDELTQKITKLYLSKGYITSIAVYLGKDNAQAIFPEKAEITIRIIEGKLGIINVTGSNRLKSYIESRISKDKPLNQTELLGELRRLNSDPLLKNLKARLLPNANFGNRSDLDITVAPQKAYELTLFSNNYRNSGIGTWEKGIDFTALNPSTLGDRLNLKYSNTLGSNVFVSEYSVPLNTSNTTLNFRYTYGSNATIEEPFSVLDIEGTSQSYALNVRHPILRRFTDKGNDELGISVGVERRESAEKILGFEFPISQGADIDGRSRTNTIELAIDYKRIRAVEAALLRAQFRYGIDFDSTTDPFFDNGQFFSAKIDGAYTHKLPFNLSFIARLSAQIADRPLIAGEQLSIGGIYSVRGYVQDTALGDSGILGSLGVSIPIYKGKIGTFMLQPFFDIGYVNNYLTQETLLAGAGLSLEYQFSDRVAASLSWGYPLLKLDNSFDNSSLQNSGVYFNVRFELL
jgi:hemolysin activation/secretion protein